MQKDVIISGYRAHAKVIMLIHHIYLIWDFSFAGPAVFAVLISEDASGTAILFFILCFFDILPSSF